MSNEKKMIFLLLSMAALLFLPWLGGYFHYDGNFPSDFFTFPALKPMEKPGFNLPIFIFVALVCAGMASVYIVPKLFGFKKVVIKPSEKVVRKNLPYWFYIGFIAWGSALTMNALHMAEPAWLINWGDVPLFWGAVLILDGIVYKRAGGRSLVSVIPQELIGIGVASMTGWMIFEYMNFFVEHNWFYPYGDIFSQQKFMLYAFIVSSGLLPLAFEWYLLFLTFPKLANRFKNGVKIVLSNSIKNIVLVLALISMVVASMFPSYLFFVLWVSPPVILGIVLNKIGVWTPFNTIAKGNWAPVLLMALTYFVTGFMLEGQNYIGAVHDGHTITYTNTPATWQYSLPFVNVAHVFEMPVLGYFGYLPFGVYCWVWWISFATLLNIPAKFLKENPLDFKTE